MTNPLTPTYPIPASDTVRENCLDLIEKIPFSCSPEPNTRTTDTDRINMEKCITAYTKPADECIQKYAKCGEGRLTGVITYFTPYYPLVRNIYANLKSINDPASANDLLTGLHDIYLQSIETCEPALISNVAAAVDKAGAKGRLGEVAEYIRNTKEIDFLKPGIPIPANYKFSNKPATLLIVWTLKNTTKKSDLDCLKEAFKYYPPITEPLTIW